MKNDDMKYALKVVEDASIKLRTLTAAAEKLSMAQEDAIAALCDLAHEETCVSAGKAAAALTALADMIYGKEPHGTMDIDDITAGFDCLEPDGQTGDASIFEKTTGDEDFFNGQK